MAPGVLVNGEGTKLDGPANINSITPNANGCVGNEQLHDVALSTNKAISSSSAQVKNPVAICGMAMRLPGGINSESDFWSLLVDKRDACCHVPADRYNIDAYHSEVSKSGTIQTNQGYFLTQHDLAHIDASFFSMTRSELEKLDPQHRLLLEITR